MYTSESSFVTVAFRAVTKMAAMFVSKEKIQKSETWFKSTFPRSKEGRSRFLVSLLAITSLILTFIVYAFAYPIAYGVGIPLMWFFHENGHLYAVRRLNLRVDSVIWWAFVGVIMKLAPGELSDRRIEAIVGISGPVFGLVTTALLYVAFQELDFAISRSLGGRWTYDIAVIFLLAIVYNFIQMAITVRPFDGGRVAQIIHPLFRPVGLVVMIAVSIVFPASWVTIMWLLVLTDMRFFFQWRRVWLMAAITISMIIRILLGYGREEWWWNVSDLVIAWLAFSWAWGQARRGRPFHLLPEWRIIVRVWRKFSGVWGERGDDRRTYPDRRQISRQSNDRRQSERRISGSIFMRRDIPIDYMDRQNNPGEFVDRRGRGKWIVPLTREGALWLLYYTIVQGGLIALGSYMFFHLPPSP